MTGSVFGPVSDFDLNFDLNFDLDFDLDFKLNFKRERAPVAANMENAKKRKRRGTLAALALMALMAAAFSACGDSGAGPQEARQDVRETPGPDRRETPRAAPSDEGPARPLSGMEFFERNNPATFSIYSSWDGLRFVGNGSGFFVDADGLAVTADHVIASAPFHEARLYNGERRPIVGYHNVDTVNDLAVIRVEGSGFAAAALGDSDRAQPGMSVFAIGTTLGYHHNRLSDGIVSARVPSWSFDIYTLTDAIQFTASIHGGNSGGPLFNAYTAEVIGVSVAGYRDHTNMGMAVPINALDLSRRGLAELRDIEALWTERTGGSVALVRAADIIGHWHWSEGFYIFNADGTGSRDWAGHSPDFTWEVAGNAISINGSSWVVTVMDGDTINIGGSLFVRGGADLGEIAVLPELVGEWEWGRYTYVFSEDGRGWRDWPLAPGHFDWGVRDGTLYVWADSGIDSAWELTIAGRDRIFIAGAEMFRRGAAQEPSRDSALAGRWHLVSTDEPIQGWGLENGWDYDFVFRPDGVLEEWWNSPDSGWNLIAEYSWSEGGGSVLLTLAEINEAALARYLGADSVGLYRSLLGMPFPMAYRLDSGNGLLVLELEGFAFTYRRSAG